MPSIPPDLQQKQEALLARLRGAGRLLVAFSGGVDSSYLAWAARRALGDDCLAVTALSPSYPRNQREMAEQIVADFDIPHRFIETHEMQNESYRANKPDRCYHCKSELFERLAALRRELRFDAVASGINLDDRGDFRPGHRAADERGVLSPLLDVGLSKLEIRSLSRAAGLPSAELPASACLSSRLPYGTEVTVERLSQVERAEERLRRLGFEQVRLRHHGDVARIEVEPSELPKALDPDMAKALVEAIKPLGFRWVSLDLEGYRSGSLNEALLIRREPTR
ncbi:MAG: ATP-dependent sacrificial sulfur transferase LarE [Myxococcota bacterium]